jgi:hypothetical protein
VTGLVRQPVREALAGPALHGALRTFSIVDAKSDAIVVSEIKFSKVAVEMFFAAMLINPAHAAFEKREVALQRIGMNGIFFRRSLDR